MRILLAEHWRSHIYAEPFLRRFRELGVEAHPFKQHPYFDGPALPGPLRPLGARIGRAEEKLRLGAATWRLNRDLVRRVRELRPDVLFLFRGEHVHPDTVVRVKRMGVRVIGWQNDDPFSPRYPRYAWRHFRGAIPLYDRLFAYRQSNVNEMLRRGCRRVELLRSFYLREENFPLSDLSSSPYRCDVSFIGHWEADGRERLVQALMEAGDFRFRLWGTLWERAGNGREIARRLGPIRPVYREQYNLAVNSSRIALAFLSGLNNDTYTRRCFEIPAAGTFMLAQHTDDLAALFQEGAEAEFFRSEKEMLEKIRHYLSHDEERRRIAEAGRQRLLRDGHEAMDRARQVLARLEEDLG